MAASPTIDVLMNARQSVDIYGRRVHRVMDYISEHLDESLPLERLARLAHFSPFHFHRVFRSMVGEPVHAFIKRLRLERAVFAMAHSPKENLTAIALRCGFASSSDFSRAFKQAYGFSPRSYTRAAFLEKSKIRQDLMANAGYGFGALPAPENPDRFRVHVRERLESRIGYVRVIGGYRPEKILAGYRKLIDWGLRQGIVPGAALIGMSSDDPDWIVASRYGHSGHADSSTFPFLLNFSEKTNEAILSTIRRRAACIPLHRTLRRPQEKRHFDRRNMAGDVG